jgi:hypothetical protein
MTDTQFSRYVNYPVLHWRLRFLEVVAQLEEIESGHDVVKVGANASRQQKNVWRCRKLVRFFTIVALIMLDCVGCNNSISSTLNQ